jgi:hypothetical protein
MGRELGVGDIEQQELGVPACGQLDRALCRDICAISGDQNEVAEYDSPCTRCSHAARAGAPKYGTLDHLRAHERLSDALVVVDDEDVPGHTRSFTFSVAKCLVRHLGSRFRPEPS